MLDVDASGGREQEDKHNPGGSQLLHEAIERMRKQLLDVSRRNPLINFRPNRQSVTLIDELPDEVSKRLEEGGSFRFLPAPQTDDDNLDGDFDPELPAQPFGESTRLPQHTDDRLQTTLSPEKLGKALNRMRLTAKTEVEETGGSSLYLALGFLEWYESDDSSVSSLAPLYLIPVTLTRRLNTRQQCWEFSLSYNEDDVQRNESLAVKLRSDFMLELPDLGTETTPEEYFQRVSDAVVSKSRWVIKREARLGFFRFQKVYLYRDLDPQAWAEHGGLERSPLLQGLLTGSAPDRAYADSSGVLPEAGIDSRPEYRDLPLPVNADSSQHNAIIHASEGRTFVLEGPPGTGKSQTITNLIAWAMGAGLRVLFVAEKLAALDVVHRNLSGIGMGTFCLQVHSDKATPGQVVKQLKEAWERQSAGPHKRVQLLRQIGQHRESIEAYLEASGTHVAQSDQPLADVFWRASALRANGHEPIPIAEATSMWTQEDVERRKEYLRALGRHFTEVDSEARRRWDWLSPIKYFASSEQSFQVHLRSLLSIAEEVVELTDQFTAPEGSPQWPTIEDALFIADNDLPDLEPPERLMSSVAAHLGGGGNAGQVRQWADGLELLQTVRQEEPGVWLLRDDQDARREAAAVTRLLTETPGTRELGPESLPDLRRVAGLLKSVLGEIESGREMGEHLAHLGLGECVTLDGLREQCRRYQLFAPSAGDRLNRLWRDHFTMSARHALGEAEERRAALVDRATGVADVFAIADVSDSDFVRTLRLGLKPFVGSRFRLLSRSYHDLRRKAQSIQADGQRYRLGDIVDALPLLEGFLIDSAAFRSHPRYVQDLGPRFDGLASDWSRLKEDFAWTDEVLSCGLGFDECDGILRAIQSEASLPSLDRIEMCLQRLDQTLGDELVQTVIAANTSPWKVPLDEISLAVQCAITRLTLLDNHLAKLSTLKVNTIAEARNATGKLLQLSREWDDFQACEEMKSVLGVSYSAEDTDVDSLRVTVDWCEVVASIGLPPWLYAWMLGEEQDQRASVVGEVSNRLSSAAVDWRTAIQGLHEFGTVDSARLYRAGDEESSPKALVARLRECSESAGELLSWAELCRAYARGHELGFAQYIVAIESGSIDPDGAAKAFELTVLESAARQHIEKNSVLQRFSRQELEDSREQFAKCDHDVLTHNQRHLINTIDATDPPPGVSSGRRGDLTDGGLIANEISKQRRHVKIRELFRRAGDAIHTLTPCVMMSPLSVARHLPPGRSDFDLVIMDEASQIKTEDALGALLRGKQAVIVGDSNQLPPSNFFEVVVDDADIDDEDQLLAEDSESVLEAAEAVFPRMRLRWHYRSKDESLIAFSNEQFYDNELIVFPSAVIKNEWTGVRYHPVVGGTCEKGRNVVEAMLVVDHIVRHIIERPGESLGVAAFNRNQADLIQECLDSRRLESQEVGRALDVFEQQTESLFVKNLENVQGDERDVIYISYTYGPPKGGGRPFQRFGPIVQAKGWRRLNVLVTRARCRVEVFTSLAPGDIQGGDGKRGVNAMRDYLKYVKDGGVLTDRGMLTGMPPDSPFEEAVMSCVRGLGFDCHPQVGVAGYRIDLGVLAPGDSANEYVLGIECDGKTYHSAKSARDRDRLREEVICARGWRLHRVWSTDWFLNRPAEEQRLKRAIESAIEDHRRANQLAL